MQIHRDLIRAAGYQVPSIVIRPDRPKGAAVIIHGYGGNKAEQVGLAFTVAEAGLVACAIDLRGHGEHPLELDAGIPDDLNAAVQSCMEFGKVTAIGHSLGGRLALTSDADWKIGISPSLGRTYGEQTQGILRAMRTYRVRPPNLEVLLDIQARLPVLDPAKVAGTAAILYAERDAPEIIAGCDAIAATGIPTSRIAGTLHGDIFTHELTFAAIRNQIKVWYGK